MFSSRVTGTARELGIDVSVVASVDAALDRVSAENRLILLDLNTPGLNVDEAVRRLRDAIDETLTIVGYASHVHEAKIQAGQEAGCDQVLSRGQFNQEIGQLLKSM